MTESLRSALKQLRLSGLLESLDVRLHEAAGHSLNHAEFLELLLQDELAVRSDRQVRRRVKAAQFRDLKTIDDFDWSSSVRSTRFGRSGRATSNPDGSEGLPSLRQNPNRKAAWCGLTWKENGTNARTDRWRELQRTGGGARIRVD